MFKIFVSLFALPVVINAVVREALPVRMPARSDGLRRSGLHCVWRRDASSGRLRSDWLSSD